MSTVLLQEYVDLCVKQGFKPCTDQFKVTSRDCLLIVDMQNDFLPKGSFGVAEGDSCVPVITELMKGFSDIGAPIYSTRDYHPVNHCSFADHGGPFPPHCVQGTNGAAFCSEMAAAMQPLIADNKLSIVYKGFCKDIDSFGAFPYKDNEATGDGTRLARNKTCERCCSAWTGSFVLFSSNVTNDCSAPPDVMAVLDKQTLADHIGAPASDKTLYIVGLALDYCVLDTAVNAALAGHKNVVIILDGSRAAHIPGLGTHGSGFLTDPASFRAQLAIHEIKSIYSKQLKLK